MSQKSIRMVVICLLLLGFRMWAAENIPIDNTLARQYFQEAAAISQRDDAALWGVYLYGPMIFVNPGNRTIVANRPDKEGRLHKEGDIYIGRLPVDENIANTSFSWAGKTWTMIMWPLPVDKHARANLMMHESFHRIQDQIGFPANNPSNNHLDEKEGRILIQLEWQALKQALNGEGQKQIDHLRSALIFREYRRKIYKNAKTSESGLEFHEGLAEYTGIKLSGLDEKNISKHLCNKVDKAKNLPTLVRSFAYISGPIYCILLDRSRTDWRKNLTNEDDLGEILANVLHMDIPQHLEREVGALSPSYGGDGINEFENQREMERLKRIKDYRKKFVQGPIVVLPLRKMNVQFDPRNLQPLDNLGTVYPNIRISDNWGILTVDGGALLGADWDKITVSALNLSPDKINNTPIRGDGWSLELKKGWRLLPSQRQGDYIIKQDH